MERILWPSLIAFVTFASSCQANNVAGVEVSQFCCVENQQCSSLHLRCPDKNKIVIMNEYRAFNFASSVNSDNFTNNCSSGCCAIENFQCLHQVSEVTFSHTYDSCWNMMECSYQPAREQRNFNHGNAGCTNGFSLYGKVSYACISPTLVREFIDATPAVGFLLMATFSPSSQVYPACVRPNSTLECLVEAAEDNGSKYVDAVVLVMNYSPVENCSKLQYVAGTEASKTMPCRSAVEYKAVDNIFLPFYITLTLEQNYMNDKAWAVVKGLQPLKMTCGRNCSATTVSTELSSTTPSVSKNASQATSTAEKMGSSITDSLTATPSEPTSTSDSSSSANPSQIDSSTTTTLGTASIGSVASQPPSNIAAIVGGVVGSSVLIIIIIVVAVVVMRRKQLGSEPKAAAREPQQGHAVANSAYDDWDLDSGDGEGGTANGSSPSVLPPKPASAQRPVTDVYTKVNKKSSRVTFPPSPDNIGPQPEHLPTCPASGEVTDVYSRPKKGGMKHPDNGDNSDDVTSPENSSSPPVIPPRRFRSSDATGNEMADGTAPEDHLAQYDHLGQKRRPTPQPGDVTYGHLGNKMAAEDPETSYDRLRGGDKRGVEHPGPAVLSSHVYGRLGTEGTSEEGDKAPYDRLGGAGRRDVIKDGVYHVASEVDIDPYSEHEPNFFDDE